jgi:hypothetical protein
MNDRQKKGIAIGEAIGALLAVALLAGLGLGLGLFSVSFQTLFGAAMIGAIIGALSGWVFIRPRPTVEQLIGVPASRRNRIMWVASMGAIGMALNAGINGEALVAVGFLALAGSWILHVSRMVERARGLLYLSGCSLVLGLLSVGTAFLFGEF